MSSLNDVLSMLNGRHIDHIPRFSGLISITQPGLESVGLSFAETHHDPAKLARAAASTYRNSGFESAVVPLDLCVEAEVLGAQVDFQENAPRPEFPRVVRPISDSFESIGAMAERFTSGHGRLPIVCEAIRLLKEDVRKEIVVGAFVPGPFTLLTLVMNVQDVYASLRKPSEAMTNALAKLTRVLVQSAQAYRDAGADLITIHEMGGSPGVIGPKSFELVVLPHLQTLIAALPHPNVLSVCGRTNNAMTLIAKAGADAISVDQTNNLAESRLALGPDALLFGNIDPVGVLANGTVEDVRRAVDSAIESGVNAVWPGCDLWPLVPLENLKALVEHSE
jgi:MtaA/CmuA family methyltransferase